MPNPSLCLVFNLCFSLVLFVLFLGSLLGLRENTMFRSISEFRGMFCCVVQFCFGRNHYWTILYLHFPLRDTSLLHSLLI